MKREGLDVELNRGKLWIYPCSGYRRIIIMLGKLLVDFMRSIFIMNRLTSQDKIWPITSVGSCVTRGTYIHLTIGIQPP